VLLRRHPLVLLPMCPPVPQVLLLAHPVLLLLAHPVLRLPGHLMVGLPVLWQQLLQGQILHLLRTLLELRV